MWNVQYKIKGIFFERLCFYKIRFQSIENIHRLFIIPTPCKLGSRKNIVIATAASAASEEA